jgi:hypothetical protein
MVFSLSVLVDVMGGFKNMTPPLHALGIKLGKNGEWDEKD